MNGPEIQRLIQQLSKLPGLGPRSGRRLALYLLKKREQVLQPLISTLTEAERVIISCTTCFNLDTTDPCQICKDVKRDSSELCIVETVADLWALERSHIFKGHYHVLGGVLSALDGMGPEQLTLEPLLNRLRQGGIREVILALNATLDGQTTIHYLVDRLEPFAVRLTVLAHGVPIGGELDYLDDGTLSTAFKARHAI